jgi:hypothetical protein
MNKNNNLINKKKNNNNKSKSTKNHHKPILKIKSKPIKPHLKILTTMIYNNSKQIKI